MSITTDQARRLLDNAEHTGRWEASYDDESDATRLYPWGEDVEITDGGSWALAAAAPDLARTVIAQAEQIEKLQGMISRASCEIDALKNPGVDQ